MVARAIAKAALASSGRTHAVGLAIAADRVVERVELLMRPAPSQRRLMTATVVAAAALTWVTTIAVAAWANNLVQLAEAVHAHH